MEEIIITKRNKKWAVKKTKRFTIRIIGKFIINNQLLLSEDAIELVYNLFSKIDFDSEEDIKKVLNDLDGFFAIIVENEKNIFVCSDKIRSYPLFYYVSNKDFCISNEANKIKEKYKLNKENKVGILEFLFSGFITADETLFLGLHQMLPGQYIIFNKNKKSIKINEYYKFSPTTKKLMSSNLKKKYNEYYHLLKKSFLQIKEGIEKYNFIPVIPLSGGRDSRLIAIMLKEVGVNNVICYTFGTLAHPEVVKSQEVANKLGYKWLFVKYTNKKWYNAYFSEQMNEYLNFASNLCNEPRFLDFIAVKELFEKQKKNYLFMPGHILDFIAGSRIPTIKKGNHPLLFNDIFKSFLLRPYSFYPREKKEEQIFKTKFILKNKIPKRRSIWEALSLFESWEWKERQGKSVINWLNIYHFFGFEWFTPFLEKDFLNFFVSLPYNFRYKQNFQKQALHHLFPNFYSKEKWLEPLTSQKKAFNLNIKRYFGKNPFVKFFNSKWKAYRCLMTDFGLKRYTAFDVKSKNLRTFALKNVLTNNVKRIFYFYTLEYLLRNNFNLDFLSSRYLKRLKKIYRPRKNKTNFVRKD